MISDPNHEPTIYWPFLCLQNLGETCNEAAERRSKRSTEQLRPIVLVADDEPVILSTIIQILRSEGYDAVGAKDGVDAVACAQSIEPDIFLADISMPKMNGIDAAKAIKARFPDTRVICFSGHAANSEVLKQARAEGHDFEFLAKPIKPEALLNAIKGTQ